MKTGRLDWSVKSETMYGESVSGDRAIVSPLDDGVLVAVVDGLGHGADAALAAERAVEIIGNNASADLSVIIQLCHHNLFGCRGAVISLVKVGDDRILTWLGVGNVAIKLIRGQMTSLMRSVEQPVLKAGLIGKGPLPRVQTNTVSLNHNDILFLATDGIEHGFADTIDISNRPSDMATEIISNYARHTDDALAFVGRYVV